MNILCGIVFIFHEYLCRRGADGFIAALCLTFWGSDKIVFKCSCITLYISPGCAWQFWFLHIQMGIWLLRNCQIILRSDCPILHLHQERMSSTSSTTWPTFDTLSVLNFTHSNGCMVVAHCTLGFLFVFIILFVYSWETQRGRDTGKGRSRIPAGSPMQDSNPGSQDRCDLSQDTQPLRHPGAPGPLYFESNISLVSNNVLTCLFICFPIFLKWNHGPLNLELSSFLK